MLQPNKILEIMKTRPMLAGERAYRLSLAGAQSKLAIGFKDGHVQLMKGGAPTTHILKPMIEHPGVCSNHSVYNELFCMKLAGRMRISVPEVCLHFVNETPYYIISRYDRHIDADGTVSRIHQEDFCQALGIVPETKYEFEGGPSIEECRNLISQHTVRPAVDQINFMDRVIFNYLIGNTDAHGKNFSLLYRQDKPELAPAYDLLCTDAYKDLSLKMAMKIGGVYRPKNIYLHHFYKAFMDKKIAQNTAQNAISKQIKRMTDSINDRAVALKEELEKDGLRSEVFDVIINVIQKRSKRLKL